MPIYWFFDAPGIARRNLLLPHMRLSFTVEEAWQAMQAMRSSVKYRVTPAYPLP
jgi:hypothetical protein